MYAALPEAPQEAIKNRPLDLLATDTAAVRAIAQAAVSVELFTIPLYMTSMYSIQGTHQINSKGNTFYKGREWPGLAPTARPHTANQKAFNIIFSVFIQEMLHLQMAANLATAIGVTPDFTSGSGLQNKNRGWTCYGENNSVIPCIVNLKDTHSYQHVRVNLEALNHNQADLFLAIEQPEKQAREQLRANAHKYFPQVPFAGWTPAKGFGDLPMFGTIGYMYECYAKYISIEYTDGQTLWDKLFVRTAVQQDMFNVRSGPGGSHPEAEYPKFKTLFDPEDKLSDQHTKAIDMMCAITDQGEGNATGIGFYRRHHLLKAVQPDYRESDSALKADYPSYDGDGKPVESATAVARFDSAAYDHYERFMTVKAILESKSEIVGERLITWEQWHAAGHAWTKEMLTNHEYHAETAPKNIPAPEEVAGALNRLKLAKATYQTLSQVSAGSIYGITSVLNTYWQNQKQDFPYPSMVGSGDRISICWAITGKAPDLSVDVPLPDPAVLYHACQGMDLNAGAKDQNCAAIAVYHTCRGSNGCHAQGGCGFVQPDSGGGSCGGSGCGQSAKAAAATTTHGQNLCGGPKPPASLYSAPSDNKCKSFGGCAVPISASQLYPSSGSMQLYNFADTPEHKSEPLPASDNLNFANGDAVYDVAWAAYQRVTKERGLPSGEKPAPNDLRIAMPPST